MSTLKPYTSKEVAEKLGWARSTVLKHALRGVAGRKHGRDWLFTEEDVKKLAALSPRPGPKPRDEFQSNRRPRGRPRSKDKEKEK